MTYNGIFSCNKIKGKGTALFTETLTVLKGIFIDLKMIKGDGKFMLSSKFEYLEGETENLEFKSFSKPQITLEQFFSNVTKFKGTYNNKKSFYSCQVVYDLEEQRNAYRS